MAKRGNGEGSVRQRSNGLWEVLITVQDPQTGEKKRISKYAKGRQEAQDKLLELQHAQKIGTCVLPSNVTLGDWMDTWLAQYVKGHNKPKTYGDYECLIRIHIKPSAVGKTPLKDIKPRNLQTFYNHKSSSKALNGKGELLSPLTVRKIHAIIHKALDQAIFDGLLPSNPANGVKLPHHEKKDMRVLTSDEQQKFLDAVESDRLEAAFVLELGSGLRIGELLALQWQDVDLERKTLRVRQSLGRIRTPGETEKTRLIIQEPKSKSGKRSIPLPDDVIVALNNHRVQQAKEKLAAGENYEDNTWVFATELGKLLEPRNFTRTFYSIIKKAGIAHINFHSLRHGYATKLLESDVHPKVAQELLGHSSIQLTLDTYSHVLPDIKQAAAEKLNGTLTSSKKKLAKKA